MGAGLINQKQSTTFDEIDAFLAKLAETKHRLQEPQAPLVPAHLIRARACLTGTYQVADEWIDTACRAKGIRRDSPSVAEEILAGPMACARYLRLLIGALRQMERHGTCQPPGEPFEGPNGQLRVPVFPTRAGMFDAMLFPGFRCHAWMEPGITRENLPGHMGSRSRLLERRSGVCLILGAGNVSSIAPTDVFTKLFQEGKAVLLKMNPINQYLGPIFEKAFASVIADGLLRIAYGGADVGAYAVEHELVDEVHITGSAKTHDVIVWGDTEEERQQRKQDGDPRLTKRITSELGNVSPWVIMPDQYSERELNFQAENIAASIVNNASFNCVATKMIVTAKGWNQRELFLDKIDAVLAKVPPREAYYPGALQRYQRFARRESVDVGEPLPWTLLRDVDPERDADLFCEESFVCVTAETALEADSPEDFLDCASQLLNERLWGSLSVAVTVHPKFRSEGDTEACFQRFLAKLKYGVIGVNHWPGFVFGMMSSPWGGYPGAPLDHPQSGIGWVHNVYMLEGIEKTVFEGPLVAWPKPLWFPTHRQATALARRMLQLYRRPAWWKLPGVILTALRG